MKPSVCKISLKAFLPLCLSLFAISCQSPTGPSVMPTPSSATPSLPTPSASPDLPPGITSCLTIGYDKGDYFQVQQFHINCQRVEKSETAVFGFVLDQQTKLGLTGANVTLARMGDANPNVQPNQTVSDGEGRFDLSFQGEGTYRLRIEKANYKPEERVLKYYYRRQSSAENPTSSPLVIQLGP